MSFDTKISFFAALVVFELGSLICGVLPNSVTLIVGGAVQGLGSAGILIGACVIVTHSVPLQKRPVFFAAIGILFGVGALVVPLLDGVFTDLAAWRWCFYLSLPIGGLTFASILMFFKHKARSVASRPSFLQRILRLDLISNVILLGASLPR
jgi:MFS family permease